MRGNKLTGSIPASLDNLTNLEYLYLNNNQLTGTIFSSLSILRNLTAFLIHHNKFYEPIDIDLSSKLYAVRMDHNYFTNIDGLSTFLEDTPLNLEQNCIRDFDPVSHLSRLTGKNNQRGGVTLKVPVVTGIVMAYQLGQTLMIKVQLNQLGRIRL